MFISSVTIMADLDPIQIACLLDGKTERPMLAPKDAAQAARDDRLAWIHLDGTHPDTRDWLDKEVAYLDDIILDALLASETRPRLLEFEAGLMLILRGVNLDEHADPEDMVSLRLWIDPYRIISVHFRPVKAVEDMQTHYAVRSEPTAPGEFLADLVERMTGRLEPVIGEMQDALDALEEKVLEAPAQDHRKTVSTVRRQAIMFRRHLAPQREVLVSLRTTDLTWLDQVHKRRLQESLDRLMRYVEDLEAIRDRAQLVKEELAQTVAERMNANLYKLSVVAAFFLPLGVIAGVLGANLGGIPGADHPLAFPVFLGILAGIVGAQVLLFKALKWI